jgi:hypothetical protein
MKTPKHEGLGLTWELADPKFDPEFLFHIVFTDSHKDEVVHSQMLNEWMLHFYVMSNLQSIDMDSAQWAIKLMSMIHFNFPPIIKLWMQAKMLKYHGSGYKLLVEPRKINQEDLKKGKCTYDN